MIKEYIDGFKSQGNINLENEIIILTLALSAPVSGYNSKMGVCEINMNDDLVTTTYDNIVKPSLAPIFEHFQQEGVSFHLQGFPYSYFFSKFFKFKF